jgi:hypothetical protein
MKPPVTPSTSWMETAINEIFREKKGIQM